MAIVHIDHSAPGKHGQREDRRNDDPGGFEARITVNGDADSIDLLAVVFEKEIDDGDGDSGGKKDTDGSNKNH